MVRRGVSLCLVAGAIGSVLGVGGTWAAPAGAAYRVGDPVIVSGPAGLPEDCGPTAVEAETFLAAEPDDPRHLVATWNTVYENLDTIAITAVSQDGGATWRRGHVGGTSRCTRGDRDYILDGWTSIGPDATAYYAALAGGAGSTPDQAILGAASADGGGTWADAQVLDENQGGAKGVLSRTSVTADPFHPGRAFALFTRFVVAPFDGTYVVRTDDGGQHWDEPVLVAQHPGGAVPAWETVVLPDGTLLAFFADVGTEGTLQQLAFNADSPAEAVVARSTDGGRTWGPPVPVVALPKYVLARAAAAPDGSVAFVFNEERGDAHAVRVTRSTDGGSTWSDPVDVDVFPAKGLSIRGIQPNIAVGADGTIGVSWYDSRRRAEGEERMLVDRWFAASEDGGQNWSRTHLAGPSEMSGDGNGDGPFGAYQGLAATASGFGALYVQGPGQAGDGHTDVFYSAIAHLGSGDRDDRLRLRVTPRRVRAGVRRTFRFSVSVLRNGRRSPVAGAWVRFAGGRALTGPDGLAVFERRFRQPGARRAHARKDGFRGARARVRVSPRSRPSP